MSNCYPEIEVFLDGDAWCAKRPRENLQEGISGWGKTESEAVSDFRRQWDEHIAYKYGRSKA